MKTLIKKSKVMKALSMMLAVMLVLSVTSISAFAAESAPAVKFDGKSLTASNFEIGDKIEVDVVDAQGNPAKLGIERVAVPETDGQKAVASAQSWKVSYTGIIINCHFFMTVTNNVVTSVYDEWILVIGGTYDGNALTMTSTYGRLQFNVSAYGGIFTALCWLKGTVTGINNDITVSFQM